jgi:hypothetical protein
MDAAMMAAALLRVVAAPQAWTRAELQPDMMDVGQGARFWCVPPAGVNARQADRAAPCRDRVIARWQSLPRRTARYWPSRRVNRARFNPRLDPGDRNRRRTTRQYHRPMRAIDGAVPASFTPTPIIEIGGLKFAILNRRLARQGPQRRSSFGTYATARVG